MYLNYLGWIEAFLGIVALIGVQYGVKRLLERTEKKESPRWQGRIGSILQPPLSVLIWVLVALYLIDVLGSYWGFSIAVKYLDALRKTTVVGCLTWFFFRWKREFEKLLLLKHSRRIDYTTMQIIGRLSSITVGVVTGLIVMQIFGVNIAPLLAFGSIGAASIGFAGKDVMANFCSGILLQITRPFVRGDQIILPEKNLEGHIEDIGWFRTSIRDREKRAVYLPNNFFSTMLVVNVSRMTHRHLKQTLKIPLEQVGKVTGIVTKIHEVMTQFSEIDPHYPLHVYLRSFGEYACEIEIEAYSTVIDQEKFNRTQQEILLKIQSVLALMDVNFAIPVMSWKQTS